MSGSSDDLNRTLLEGLQHHQAGNLPKAEALYTIVLQHEPNHADALHLLGVLAAQQRRDARAIELLQKAITQCPRIAAWHHDLGNAFKTANRYREAIESFQNAVSLTPSISESHLALAECLALSGNNHEAAALYLEIVETIPSAEGYYRFGNVLRKQGKLESAVTAYRKAVGYDRESAKAFHNLGCVLQMLDRLNDAETQFRATLRIDPNFPGTQDNLDEVLQSKDILALSERGALLHRQNLLDEAEITFREAIARYPHVVEFHNNLGNVLKDQGHLDEALDAYRDAVAIDPENASVHSNLVYSLRFHPDITPERIANEEALWEQRHALPILPENVRYQNQRDPNRRLKIGYVSADFCAHVVGMNLRPLFRNHDHQWFEIFCYSGVSQPDLITTEFRGWSDHWKEIGRISDEDLAERVRADEIDILVDLSLHMAGNRLPVFARKPAPIQMSFAGYPGRTGLRAIDYHLTDQYLEVSDGESPLQSKIPKLHSFWCYEPLLPQITPNSLPASQAGHLTFGCLNNFCKINRSVLALWARVLREVDQSHLLLLTPPGRHRTEVSAFFDTCGVATSRIHFSSPQPLEGYLRLYHCIDIMLDTFPYNGHTTSLDALWMGVPVVSLCGRAAVSRAGLSQLSNIGHHKFTTESEEEFIRIAKALAGDLGTLSKLRKALRSEMEKSCLMNGTHFAEAIQGAYRAAWTEFCSHDHLIE